MGLFNLGGSEQRTTQTTTNEIENRNTEGGDIVTTDSEGANIQNISGQELTINNTQPDPSIGILEQAVDSIAGFAGQAIQQGSDAQTRALQFASGVDVQGAQNARMTKTTRNLLIGGAVIAGLFLIFKALR